MKYLKLMLVMLMCGTLSCIAYAATITGTISFDGTEELTEVPERKLLDIKTNEQHCLTVTKDAKSEELVVSKGKGIQNVVVYVRVSGHKATPLKEKPILDQKDCRYLPHVLVVPTGTTVALTSDDPVAHNVNSHATKNEAKNLLISKKGIKFDYKLTKAEAIKLTCDVHSWMSGYIVVVDSNFYTVVGQKDEKDKFIHPDTYEESADTGKYKIEDVPAGRARVIAWHETLGTANKTLTIPESGELTVDFKSSEFKKPKKK